MLSAIQHLLVLMEQDANLGVGVALTNISGSAHTSHIVIAVKIDGFFMSIRHDND